VSRRGFFYGLLAGMVLMGLLAAVAGVVMVGVRWPWGRALPLRGSAFHSRLTERGFGFALPGRLLGVGLSRRPLGFAFFCLPALLLIFGALVLFALAGRRWLGHRPDRDHDWSDWDESPAEPVAAEHEQDVPAADGGAES
jgi:hypothetical protein